MNVSLHLFDWLLILGYLLLLIWLGWRRGWVDQDEESYLLSGRRVTLPAFVASLVSTWYGGILGVGEYSYQFGISQWLILGAPYYLFSALFAVFLAGRIRKNRALTIPEAIGDRFGKTAGRLSAIPVFLLVNPAPYILMLAFLLQLLTGTGDYLIHFSLLASLFSVLYISAGGFGAVLRTDMLQVVLMYSGFILLFIYAASLFGSPAELWKALPEQHRDPTGGHNLQYILVWFFIALWTFVDPAFHQRAAAAKSPETARNGIFISILLWCLFDFLTLFCGMYGLAILGGEIEHPALVYPLLAETLLPIGIKGLFFVTLLAVIMSTLDSFLFLAGQTLGRDLLSPLFPESGRNRLTRLSILLAALLAVLLILLYPSVIDLWYVIGSVLLPGLLVPVLGVYLYPFRLRLPWFYATLIGATGISLFWLVMGTLTQTGPYSYAYLGVEPFWPGFLLSLLFWFVGRERERQGGTPQRRTE